MVLRLLWSVPLIVVAGFALVGGSRSQRRVYSRTGGLFPSAVCPQLPSGAEPDVLESAAVLDANYAVSTTPDGGTASWGQNTNGHTATFTVTNTGICNDTYSFSATGTGGITGISLNKTSQAVSAGQFTTVTVTYNVTTAGSATLTLTASAGTGGESDNGYFNVTVVSYGVSVTPDAQPITVAAGTSQSVVLQVQNTGSASNTYSLACTTSTNETCGTITPTSLTIAAGASSSDTVHFTTGAVGTSGTVTLTASGSGGATDNGSFSVTNATFGVAVTPDARPRSVAASTSQTVTFQVRNTGTVNDTYALTCVVAGSETCGTVSPSTLTSIVPGVANLVSVTFTAGGAGTSGTVTLHGARTGGFGAASDDGSFNVTNATPLAAVTPHAQALSVPTNSRKTITFTLQNLGAASETYTATCATTGSEACNSVNPSLITVGPGQAGPISVSFAANAVGSGTVTLHVAGNRGGSDDGSFSVTNTAPPPTYGVTVTPAGYSTTARSASQGAVTFAVQNIGTMTDTFALACSAGGPFETCLPNPGGVVPWPQVMLGAGASAPVTVNFSSGSTGTTGSIGLLVTSSGGASGQAYYSLTNVSPPAQQCVALLGVSAAFYGADPDVLDLARPLGSSICPPVTVVPLSSSATWQGNTGGHIALFAITDTSGAPSRLMDLSCSATPPVTCGSLSAPAVSLGGGSTTTIAVTYSVGTSGTGSLKLTATSDNSPQITTTGSMSVTASPPTYSVAVTPHGQALSVDVQFAQSATFQVQSTGTGTETYTLTCTATGNEACGSMSPSSVTGSAAVAVSFTTGAVGTGTVMLRAVGSSGARDSGTYAVKNTYFVAVTPHGVARSRLTSRSYGDTFVVRNAGLNQTTYTLTATCTGTGVSGCTPAPTSLTLASGDSGTVAVSYTSGAAGASGQVKLIATASADATAKDSGWASVTVGTAQAPVVDVASVNPGTTRERSLCLSFATGDAAATECGDLRVVHPLPATRTLNKLRVPMLLYNSAEARPYPLVAANVTLPATAATPDTVIATLKIGTVTYGTAKWSGADWAPGSTRRIVVADTTGSLVTGIYAYTVTVTNQWNGVSSLGSPAMTAQVPVVSRQQTAFGAGWWLAGVERLYPRADSMLWVGGDGSTRQYTLRAPNVWGAPNVDRPDTLKKDPVLRLYTRFLPHGVRVVFDTLGHHVFTIDRLSDTTQFIWGGGDTLRTITLPRGLVYQFTYTSGSRWLVTAPGTPTQTRVDSATITSGRLTGIRGPDPTGVTFGYGSGADANLMISRNNRRGYGTTYGYDGGKKLVQSLRPEIGTTRWQPLETVGYPASDFGHATDTALAYARYVGARSDVWDTTAFWLDRAGAPRRIVNALGYQTLVTRDSVWPALAKQVQGPTGLVTQATYDAHGNVLTATQINPLGDGQNAVTTYVWDTVWDFVKTTTLPQREVSQAAYDLTNGNRLWQQPGPDSTRRVRFLYTNDTFKQLRAVQYPTSPVTSDSVFYDAVLRNVDTTKTPLGFVISHFTDAIGRDTLTKSIDVAVVSGRIAYDLASRDTLNVTFPADSSTMLTVRKHYDAGGNQDSLQTLSTPDGAAIGWIQHVFTYDGVNRNDSEHLLGPVTSTITFRYDPAGNLTNGGRQGGNNVTVTYDALNRPISRAQVGGDTAVFAYDTLGDLVTANNANAQITRTYYRNGALQSETQALGTDFMPAHDFSQHIYSQQFRYDLNGRRVWAKHPAQLSPGSDTVAYVYDSVFGQLKALTDVLGDRYAFAFDSLGRPRRLTRFPVGQDSVYETIAYDADGRLTTRSVQTGTTTILSEALQYFGGGSRVHTATHSDFQGTFGDQFGYSGLGGLTSSSIGLVGPETYRVDALSNRTYADHGSGVQPDNYTYSAATGRSAYREEIRPAVNRGTGRDTTFYYYANDGRLTFTDHRHDWVQMAGGCNTCAPGVEHLFTNSYYDPELRLVKTEFRQDSQPGFRYNYSDYITDETYRYDALGRRAYTRVVRGVDCLHHDPGSGCKSLLTRTVWDGSQVLYEIQVPGDSGAALENDAPASDSVHGVVGYLHAGGIDQPLALWKSNEALVLPFANYRGAFVTGTCPTTLCNTAFFPAGQASSFGDPPVFHYGPPLWHGSIVQGGTDASGYQYKRNRYYDPNSGRFTQEDPIGLAGGLNLYGFAGGDPINYSDPFGLCPQDKPPTPCKVYSIGADLSKVQSGTMAALQQIADASGHDLGVGFATEGHHADPCHENGCAVDVDEIDHTSVGTFGQRNEAANSKVSDVEDAARANGSVHQVITPNGNWASSAPGAPKRQLPLKDRPEKHQYLWSEHQSHLHISAYPDQ